jgi:hypothetical protein
MEAATMNNSTPQHYAKARKGAGHSVKVSSETTVTFIDKKLKELLAGIKTCWGKGM